MKVSVSKSMAQNLADSKIKRTKKTLFSLIILKTIGNNVL